MADIDDFATSLLEEAKCFLEKASGESAGSAQDAFIHSGLLLAFCSLEAHVNALAEEFASRSEFSPHDRGVLLEKEVRLENGEFKLKSLRMYRLDERILFLHKKVSGKSLDRTASWWSELATAIDLRNKLTHPKQAQPIGIDELKRAVQAIIDTIDALYRGIYKKGFPAANRGLQSRMDF